MSVQSRQALRLLKFVAEMKKHNYPNAQSFAELLRKIDLEENIQPSTLAIYFDAQTTQAIEDGILKFTCYNKFGRTLAMKEFAPGEWQVKKQLSGAQEEVYIGVSLKKKTDSVDYSFETSLLH